MLRGSLGSFCAIPLALALAVLITPTEAVGQESGTITGTVVQAQTARPLSGVQVFLEPMGTQPTGIGTLTGTRGQFILRDVPAGTYTLRAQLVGHKQAEQEITVRAGATETVTLEMSETAIELDEIVVTGAGVATERRKLGNTIATINTAALQDHPAETVSELLQGREAGVVGLPSGGLTGEGTQIRIRGSASLTQSNEPIVYVDGVRVDNAGGFAAGVYAGGGGSPSRLDDINPESIERIEILKGAAAATLYGTEASNGVIQIFTKSGASGAPQWNFQVEQGFSDYPIERYKPNAGFARTPEQAALMSEFYGQDIEPFEVITVPFMERVFETGNSTAMSGSVAGGSSAVTYFMSGRYTYDDGPFGGENLGPASDIGSRKQGTVTVNIFPTEKLRIRGTSLYSENSLTVPNNNNNIYGSSSLAMFGKPEWAFCNPGSTAAATFQCIDETTGEMGTGNPTGQVAFMTLRESMQQQIGDEAQHYNGSVDINYELLPTVNLSGLFGVDFTSQRSFEFAPFDYDLDDFTGNFTEGFKDLGERNHREVSFDAKANWNTEFEAFSSSLVVGTQVFHSQEKTAGGFGYDFPGPGLEVISAAAERAAIYEFFLTEVNAGVFAQEQVGFNDWAFLTLGARYDANSAFGENFEGVLYPKASLSVIPSDRRGWGSPLGISSLRLRTAIGQSGQQPGAFDKFTTFSPLPSSVGAGVQPLNLGNQDLKPEISTEWEVGADLGFFGDRLSLDVTYWDRVVNDALMERQFPVTGGFINEQLVNIGEIDANGWEFALNGVAYRGEQFGVDVFANASYLSERVTDLGGAPPLKVGGSYPRYRNFVMGPEDTDGDGVVDTYYAPGALFGAKLLEVGAGLVPFDTNGDGQPDTEAEFRRFLETVHTEWAGGGEFSIGFNDARLQPLLADEDGDGDVLDHYLGKPMPDWQGAFGFNLGFLEHFELSTLFEYKAGNFTVTNLTDAFRKSNAVIGRNTPQAAEAEAAILNPESTTDEKFEAAMLWANELRALAPYSGLNTMEDGDFVRWREASLTVRVPTDFLGRMPWGVSSAAITLAGRNLALWTDYSGIDPELNVYGRGATSGIHQNFGMAIDAFGLAIPRRYQISVRLGF